MRTSEITRETKETKISVSLSPDGGDTDISTGVGFFDHMLSALSLHGGIGLTVRAEGDLHVDSHHLVEDVGIVIGKALDSALGDKSGIVRFGHAYVPMDEALAFAAIDLGGRPFFVFDAVFPQDKIGEFDACLVEEFMRALAMGANCNLHLRCEYGGNSHHIAEALFKATAKAIHAAVRIEGSGIPSTKGVI